MDKIDGVIAFVKAVEAGSFIGAARKLGLTASAVSKRVAALEDRLGVRLLNRTTRSLSVTPDGTSFYERCARILSDLEEAEFAISGASACPRGRLRIDLPVALGRTRIVPALAGFAERYPEVALDVALNDRLVDLVDEGVDVAVRFGELKDSRLVARKLARTRFVVCAAPAYLARRGAPTALEDLRHHDCLAYVYPHSGRTAEWQVSIHGERKGITVEGRMAFNNVEALLAAAEVGAGLVQLGDYLAAGALARGALLTVLNKWMPEGPSISAIYAQNRHLSPKVRALVDFLVELFASHAGKDLGQ